MMSKGTVLAVIVGSITYWVLEGLWMGLLMGDHYAAAYAPYRAVMADPMQANPAIWFVGTTVVAAIITFIVRRGDVSVRSGAICGAVFVAGMTFVMEWGMSNMFINYPFVPTSLISVAWEAVSGGATGAAIGAVMARFGR